MGYFGMKTKVEEKSINKDEYHSDIHLHYF
jgi:hypothetical protein